ncbi:hypothetical protein DL764_003466 [Monosporascus ibericus]|uniref:Rhodopsin domain-containing protein n=1 Tax=Monosporascus ibericus TaxID=155417 RepID=A0A4Q4TI76_9PEZI|nr:hypothetical protein DL764_003466 [Monosporascus ibericus]
MDTNGTLPSTNSGLVYLPVLPFVKAQLIVNIMVAILVLVVVCVRVVGRRFGPGLGWDDGLPLAISLLAGQGLTLHIGGGYDQNEHPEVFTNISYYFKVIFAMQQAYIVALAATKASVLCFYLRVFTTTNVGRASKWLLGFCVVWALAFMLAPIFICRPVSAQWTGLGKCGNLVPLIQSAIITNIVSDLVIMCLPMHSIWSLQARKADKIGVMTCFALGLACVVCCLVRLIYLVAADANEKLTATLPTMVFLIILEPNLAIICVSIPMLRPLYTMYRTWKGGSRLREVSDKRITASGGGLSGRSGRSGQPGRGAMAAITSQNNTTDWEMEDYRSDTEAQHGTAVTAAANDSGSEENLTNSEPATRRGEGAIRVETVWTMSHN